MGLKAHASTLGFYASLGDWFKKSKPRGPSTAPSVAFAASCSARDDKILFGVLITGPKGPCFPPLGSGAVAARLGRVCSANPALTCWAIEIPSLRDCVGWTSN